MIQRGDHHEAKFLLSKLPDSIHRYQPYNHTHTCFAMRQDAKEASGGKAEMNDGVWVQARKCKGTLGICKSCLEVVRNRDIAVMIANFAIKLDALCYVGFLRGGFALISRFCFQSVNMCFMVFF